MNELLTLTVSGAVTGAIYSLVAAGVMLSYTATGIFNFAYGAIAYVSAVMYFELNTALGWSDRPVGDRHDRRVRPVARRVPRLGGVPATCPCLAGGQGRRAGRPDDRPAGGDAVTCSTALIELVRPGLRPGTERPAQLRRRSRPASGPVPREEWKLPGGATLDSNQLALVIAAAVVAVALWVLLRHSTSGLRMRAVVDSTPLARLRGHRLGADVTIGVGHRLRARRDRRCGRRARARQPQLELVPRRAVRAPARRPCSAASGACRSPPRRGVVLGVAQNLVVRLRRRSPPTSRASTRRCRSCSCSAASS